MLYEIFDQKNGMREAFEKLISDYNYPDGVPKQSVFINLATNLTED